MIFLRPPGVGGEVSLVSRTVTKGSGIKAEIPVPDTGSNIGKMAVVVFSWVASFGGLVVNPSNTWTAFNNSGGGNSSVNLAVYYRRLTGNDATIVFTGMQSQPWTATMYIFDNANPPQTRDPEFRSATNVTDCPMNSDFATIDGSYTVAHVVTRGIAGWTGATAGTFFSETSGTGTSGMSAGEAHFPERAFGRVADGQRFTKAANGAATTFTFTVGVMVATNGLEKSERKFPANTGIEAPMTAGPTPLWVDFDAYQHSSGPDYGNANGFILPAAGYGAIALTATRNWWGYQPWVSLLFNGIVYKEVQAETIAPYSAMTIQEGMTVAARGAVVGTGASAADRTFNGSALTLLVA